MGWSSEGPHRKSWSFRWQNFPISCSQQSRYDKMHVILKLGYYRLAAEFAHQESKPPYVGMQLEAPTRSTGCRKVVDSIIKVSACVLNFSCESEKCYRICPHLNQNIKSLQKRMAVGFYFIFGIVSRLYWNIYPTVGDPFSTRDMAPTPSSVTYCCPDDDDQSS